MSPAVSWMHATDAKLHCFLPLWKRCIMGVQVERDSFQPSPDWIMFTATATESPTDRQAAGCIQQEEEEDEEEKGEDRGGG